MTQPFVSPLNIPKPNGEIDLIIQAGQIMVDHGMLPKVEMYYANDPNIRMARGKIVEVQLRILRQYFGDQFMLLQNSTGFDGSIDTLDIRQHILTPHNPEQWLLHFKDHVVPFLIQHDLPGPGIP